MTFGPNHVYARVQRENWKDAETRAQYQAIRLGVQWIHAQMKRKLNGAKLYYRGIIKNRRHYLLLGTV